MLPKQAETQLNWTEVLRKADAFGKLLLSSMAVTLKDFPRLGALINFHVRSCMPIRHTPSEMREDLSWWLDKGSRVVVLAGPRRHGQQLADAMIELGMSAQYKDVSEITGFPPGMVTVTRGTMLAGFEYPSIGLAVVTDKELFAQDKKKRRKGKRDKNAQKIESFTDLRVGDYIVHDNHGIGVFKGIEQVVTDGRSRDYLKLEYADGGHLYVQTSQMDVVQKYIGGAANAKLSKLGGADWVKAKARARKAIEILAQDLIDLYAKRQASQAYIYGQDTVWQTEFESMFPYEETDDQITAIEDVKKDMESTRIMDRLICGDVGYGKTEIAIRAAFKAVQDNKQVAFLVPTTILAQQHYLNFKSRMKDYPVAIERLSRFQTKKEQGITVKNLEKGAADIVIGTHRLLSKDVRFKDLGLVIVDEEQRFGVSHKEKLKALKSDVDVLTLTATPIPRTLHLSLSGIRDMSLLNEPPGERRPVQTYVMEYNQEFVRDAINRELARGGQVYYLHNRVRSIQEEAAKVQALVPQARVAYGHGQMSEVELENVMMEFVEGQVQVLVCTTIVETGMDIPNVNTIIIRDADFMGLSQLYQLRGRVGRSSRLAYAYLMYRRDKVLSEESEKRLQTIREFTEFGSGFKIAMRDLEIRGAGNILGAEQHGHMDAIGYDMYCKLLNDAVGELRGEPVRESFETNIDINVDAYIPVKFIPDEQQKLEMYKKIALIGNMADYYDVQEEMEDRFGEIPKPVQNLLEVALLKGVAHTLGVMSVAEKRGEYAKPGIVITFRADATVNVDKLTDMIAKNPSRLLLTMAPNPYITFRSDALTNGISTDGGAEVVKQTRELLEGLVS
jgi:transcription-repair coupling factor (superfamily II helicase)